MPQTASFHSYICIAFTMVGVFLKIGASQGQTVADTAAHDTTGGIPAITFHAYAEGYIGIDPNKPTNQDRPLSYNFDRDREFNVNLAYLEITGKAKDYRFKFVPAFGTYMEANYRSEPAALRFLYEANAGLRLSARHNVWLDMGVLPSPFGYEGATSIFQNTLTRSLSAEYSPYYLTGARLSMPIKGRTTVALYVINGWQIIRETNLDKSLAVQFQHQPTAKWLLNYSLYVGNDRRDFAYSVPTGNQYRNFHDFYATYKPSTKITLVALFDIGFQNGVGPSTRTWYTANITGKFTLASKLSASLRAEVLSDLHDAHVFIGSRIYGGSAGVNWGITDRALLRLESRLLVDDRQNAFRDSRLGNVNWYNMNTLALSVYY